MSPVGQFLEFRDAAQAERFGDGGPTLCDALTDTLDRVVVELYTEAPQDVPFALVALGGYGRREQCLHSDVDLMLLHAGGDVEDAAAEVFRPLWDAGLKVGHSVRTVPEAIDAARQRFDTLTSLLSARLVAGEADLYSELAVRLAKVVAGKPLAPLLGAAERERRDLEPYPVMAANLKEGRGGLRTFQGLKWERRRAALLGIEPTPIGEGETEAFATLLTIRNALHAVNGRAHDTFSVGLREPVARWMGKHPEIVAGMLVKALHEGDRLADRAWPDLQATTGDPLGSFRKRLAGTIKSRFRSEVQVSDANSALTVAVAAAGRPGALRFTRSEIEVVESSDASWHAADRAAFVQLIGSGERGRSAFSMLDRLGWVDRVFPEWVLIRGAPQLAPFHDHPVDSHLWRCTDEMGTLLRSGDDLARSIAEEIGSPEELYLAAFFHDIGKRRGGDHAKIGADLTVSFCRRAGFGPATTAAVAHAVRHHLLLADVAFRRDIGRDEVIDEVIDAVGTLRRLQVLYLLTIADARATGSSMWTDWKASLLRTLYIRCAARFGAAESGGDVVAAHEPDLEPFTTAAEDHEPRMVEEHLAAMPNEYSATTSPADVAWHLDALKTWSRGAEIHVKDVGSGHRVVVVADDRAGFLFAVASVFAANGIDVFEARLFTRDDGIVVDTFQVAGDTGDGTVPDRRWDRIRADLAAVLSGDLDLADRVAERARAYRRSGPAVPVRVTVADEPATGHTVVRVRCADRIGRLAQIVGALTEAGCEIHYAKLDVRGDELIDSFLVRRDGHPIRDEAQRAAVGTAVSAAVEQSPSRPPTVDTDAGRS